MKEEQVNSSAEATVLVKEEHANDKEEEEFEFDDPHDLVH